jgi:uracil-DNA glycosylase
MAGSHQGKGWETFTNAVIKLINDKLKNVVFLLWGCYAKKKKKFIDTSKHYVLETGHPSPLSANRGYWFGNKHFSNTNYLLQQAGESVIDWKLM